MSFYNTYEKQESRAVARKLRDAAAVLFGLKFADNIHYTSLRVANRKRACNFLLVINSNFGLILPRFRDIAGCRFSVQNSDPTAIPPEF